MRGKLVTCFLYPREGVIGDDKHTVLSNKLEVEKIAAALELIILT